jgi:hypothetical protein
MREPASNIYPPLSESLVVWEPKEKGFYPYRIIQRM